MFGEQELRRIAEQVLAASRADETEVILSASDDQLTRFANSHIHQNVAEVGCSVRVRALVGQRSGVASTNDITSTGLQVAAQRAADLARLQPANPEQLPLAEPRPVASVAAFVERTAAYTPEERARAVGAICRLAQEKGLNASGAFTTAQNEIALANSRGLFAYHPSTVAELTTVVMGEDSSGYASRTNLDVATIDAEGAGREAVDKALRGRNPGVLAPGVYPVVLESYAVTEMLLNVNFLAFSAQAVQEGRSFLGGRFGQRIMDPRISVWDDGLDPRGLPMPFDLEGTPKQRVDIVKDGVAAGVVYDRMTAARDGRASTGHGLPQPNTMGPLALNLFMAAGGSTREELARKIDRGLWVTRFWYVNPVHPLLAILTGMTRDGTYLIENGEITTPVKNLRFTQSAPGALDHVLAVGRQTSIMRDWQGGAYAPDLALSEFNFTSGS